MASFLSNFRYPGFTFTNGPQLPTNFGPPNMSQQIQGAIGGMVDPIVARLNQQEEAAKAKRFAEQLEEVSRSYQTPTSVTPAGQSSPRTTAQSTTEETHAPLAQANPEVRNTFLNTLEQGGLKNPYGLAAFAATGEAETGWSPGRVNTAWNDLGKPSGGTLSWRAERLQAMRNFTRGAEDPVVAQAQFALQENPELIRRLNEAKSPEEANSLMANAWRYRGYNQPGTGEYAKREALTKQYAAQLGTAAPAPAPAPTASFAPQVVPAPDPAAAAAVTAPQGQPTMAEPTMPLPRRGPQAQGGAPIPPGPQAQAPAEQAPQQQGPQDQQEAQQQEILANVSRGNQEVTQRLDQQRQAGQAARAQIASLDPNVGISPALPGLGLGGVMPGGGGQPPPPPNAAYDPALTAPRPVRTSVEPPPPPDVPLPPQRPPPPAGSPAAPAAAAGSPVVPPAVPAAYPIRVAQLNDLPPLIADQQVQRPIGAEQARALLNAASTPEQYNAAVQLIMASRQGQKQSADRFQLIHDKEGNWVQLDRLTGATRTQRAGSGPGSAVPKEVREAERQLFNDFESTETVKKYRELEQGVQGLKSAFQGGNANADLVAVIQLFKAIDPGSTVTGAESASVRNAAGVPETLRAMFNRGLGEGGQFSPALRAEIFNTAQRMQQSKVQQVEKHAEAYKRRAKAYGLDPDRTVAFDPFKFEKAKPEDFPDINQREAPAAAARTPLTAGSSPENRIDVPNEAAALAQPPGTYFRLPDGRTGRVSQ